MDTLRIEQIKENLWALDELGNDTMFVYKGSNKVLLFDTGFGTADLKSVVKDLAGDLPVIVVNSHAHPDHNGGNNQFEEVYCGKWDEPFNHDVVTGERKEQVLVYLRGSEAGRRADLSNWNPGPAKKVLPVVEGDLIELGDIRLEVLEMPGHSPGSIALFDAANRLMFTGDVVLTWEVWGHLDTSLMLRYYAETLIKLGAYEDRVDMVLPGHANHENRYGFPTYWMPPQVLSAFAEGVQELLDGKLESRDIETFAGNGKAAKFTIGGMIYNPERI